MTTTFTVSNNAQNVQKKSHALSRILVALSVAATFGVAAPAYAGDNDAQSGKARAHEGREPGDKRGHHALKDPSAFIQRFDKNRDGKLTIAELPERAQKRLGAADANKDGVLSIDELRARAEAKAKERFAKMDANGDGVLTASEIGDKRWAHLKAADANGDAKLTAAELRAARESGKLKGPRKHQHRRPGGEKA